MRRFSKRLSGRLGNYFCNKNTRVRNLLALGRWEEAWTEGCLGMGRCRLGCNTLLSLRSSHLLPFFWNCLPPDHQWHPMWKKLPCSVSAHCPSFPVPGTVYWTLSHQRETQSDVQNQSKHRAQTKADMMDIKYPALNIAAYGASIYSVGISVRVYARH